MKIADVMTTEVLSVQPQTTLKDVARMLDARGISGLPVVDEDENVLGVVSEADILAKERRPTDARRVNGLRAETRRRKADARTAGEAMTAPAVTITADCRLDVAAGLMLDRGINRLPVVDDAGTLVGIVTRADLVRAFTSADDRVAREIRDEVLLRELWVDPREFELTVEDGVVTLAGQFDSAERRESVRRRIRLVPGVVAVTIAETVRT